MTYNDFNSRINLPTYCRDTGLKDHDFIRLPRFGWFAVNSITGKISSLIDFVPLKEVVAFCTDLITEKRQYHDGRIFYNEVSVTRLCNDIRIMVAMRRMQEDAVVEFNEGRATADGKTVNIAKMYNDNGMKAFAQTGVGYMSPTLYASYVKSLDLHKTACNKLIIPTWCTPQHVCSFESSPIGNPLVNRTTFFINGEKGWYGRPEKSIVSDMKQLLTHPGCTWDPKLNFWATGLLNLDDSLNVKQIIDIWSNSKGLRFRQSPLDELERRNGIKQVKDSMQGLSLAQISELEKRFQLKLGDLWQAQKYKTVRIGHLTFVARDMRYYAECSSGTVEVTNFAIEIHRIEKKSNGKYYRSGIISYEGKQEPFEMPNENFLTTAKFVKTITEFFFDKGLGVPIISSSYRGYVLEIVNRLNVEALIDRN
jgi:hypothetical protein